MSTLSRPSGVSRPYFYALSFLAGCNVMLLEMCAFRVLTTTFGSSIHVTGVLLALVMIALAGGYWIGGRASRRSASIVPLLGILAGATVYVLVTGILLSEPILDRCFALRKSFDDVLLRDALPPSLVTLVLYAVPMTGLSQVSPFLIKVLAASAEGTTDEAAESKVGVTAGNLMAISTLGSIAGTLLPSFVLLPLLGVQKTLWIFCASMAVVVGAGAALTGRRPLAAGLVAALGVGWLVARAMPGMPTTSEELGTLVHAGESRYGSIAVWSREDDKGVATLSYMPSRGYVHSTVLPQKPLSDQFTDSYVNVGIARGARRWLVLGMALGGAVAAIVDRDPAAQVTAIEIDPDVIDLAKRLLPNIDRPSVRMVAADARLFLREDAGQYDYVLVDLFAGEQLPPHCVTEEFFRLAKARLAPDGVMFMNTNLWDWEVETGLEPAPVAVPVRNLHAALYAAGFSTLLQNDYFETGHLYAFPKPTALSDVTALLEREAHVVTTPGDLRASYAAAALNLKLVPVARRDLRPIRDEWVPEHLLHLKENFEGYVRALTRASARPEWAAAVADRGDARQLMAAHYARFGASGAKDLAAFAGSPAGAPLCADVLAWARGAKGRLYGDLARYVRSEVLRVCGESWDAPDPDASVAAFQGYARAARLMDENRGEEALPELLAALDARGDVTPVPFVRGPAPDPAPAPASSN